MQEKEELSKILVVDDEKINIDVLVGLLKPYYRTVVAKDGMQALKRLETQPLPDLILLDIIMPGMNGYEVCIKIKDNPATRDIPVIFITGKHEEDDEARGFWVGAVDYITKPFSPLIALSRVKNHIELKRRGDMLERLAGLDGLTGIPNRRQFDQFLNAEWKRSLRYNRSFSLIFIDIDFFKLFNDHYGHTKGDECLKKVAHSIFNAAPRTEDLTARYGGEEFACILPETGNEGALKVARRIIESVRALKVPHVQSKIADYVTISVGLATASQPLGRALNLVSLADKAVYQAKEKGRNQIVNFNDIEQLIIRYHASR
ncbi:diguanylate cyclase [Desulfobacterales bacterium HSG16]|nr:diguanylate cyclase [Desulfobacterales bacterium HSG16]